MNSFPTPVSILQAQRAAIAKHNRRFPDQKFPACAYALLRQVSEKETADHLEFMEASNEQAHEHS